MIDFNQGDAVLEVVALASLNAHRVALNGRLDLELGILTSLTIFLANSDSIPS